MGRRFYMGGLPLKAELERCFRGDAWAILHSNFGLAIEGQSFRDTCLRYVATPFVEQGVVRWRAALRWWDGHEVLIRGPEVTAGSPLEAIGMIHPGIAWADDVRPDLDTDGEDACTTR